MTLYKNIAILAFVVVAACGGSSSSSSNNNNVMTGEVKIVLLHHSTGQGVWDAGVSSWMDTYNASNKKTYSISENWYPADPYPDDNYPYDYWNIWVNHAGSSAYNGQDTLEILTQTYNVIVFKHCFPVSDIDADTGSASVSSSDKRVENYKLQYTALKNKLHEFPNTRFIIWTGAARKLSETDVTTAARARTFFDWVKNTWDEPGDNIFVWDFFELETEGGDVLKEAYASGDSHPNDTFNSTVVPYLGQRIVDVIEGRGDTGNIKGQ